MPNQPPRIGLNVLCQGAIHPKTFRPTHPAVAKGGPAELAKWIKDKLRAFPTGAPVLVRIPGGWTASDGPVHLFHQLAMGWLSVLDFLDEMEAWGKLIHAMHDAGHPLYFYFGPPRNCTNRKFVVMMKTYFALAHGIAFDNTAGSAEDDKDGRERDIQQMKDWAQWGCKVGTEGWPQRRSPHWADPDTLVFLQSNNARKLLADSAAGKLDPAIMPIDDWNFTGDTAHERIHLFIEEPNEDTNWAVMDTALTGLALGATVYINTNPAGRKWNMSPAVLEQMGRDRAKAKK